jgi:hypothetical protein
MFIEATGTFGSASLSVTGGTDPSDMNFASMVNPSGTAIAITTDGMDALRDAPPYIMPVTAGGTSTDIDVVIWMKVAVDR